MAPAWSSLVQVKIVLSLAHTHAQHELGVIDDDAVEKSVELLDVDPVGTLYLRGVLRQLSFGHVVSQMGWRPHV
jgi:hypothetical protein